MNYFDPSFDLLQEIQKADAGDIDAIHGMLGYKPDEGDDEPDLQELRLKYINMLTEKEDPVGLIILADQFRKGTYGKKEPLEAIKLYRKAVDAGISFGLECIGHLYYLGEGVEKDYKKAFEYMTKESKQKAPETNFYLGEMYRDGLYCEQDDNKAIAMYIQIITGENTWMDMFYPLAAFRLAQYGVQDKLENVSVSDVYDLAEIAHKEILKPSKIASDRWITPEMAEKLWLDALRKKEEE